MGTPDFAVPTLKLLLENNYEVVGVVTAPDKPAGRGQHIQETAVKKFAVSQNLKVLQPEKLKSPEFLEALKNLNADLQIVVAFRMLPVEVWDMPPLGTYNLHASLLPFYRGAAPINWAIINGEKISGVPTFKLKHQIDTGSVLKSAPINLSDDLNAGQLHDELMILGARLMLDSVKTIESGNYELMEQPELPAATLKHAPKLFKENCRINWNCSVEEVHNLVRGLSPYPAAWTEGKDSRGMVFSFKIYKTEKEMIEHKFENGTVISDHKKTVKVACKNGFIVLKELQLAGKKRLNTEELLKGFKFSEQFLFD